MVKGERGFSVGADQREAAHGCKLRMVLPLQLPPFPSLRCVFGTARSGPGRAGFARRSEPWRARTVLKDGEEGKGGWTGVVYR
jgi:hypothetical protein